MEQSGNTAENSLPLGIFSIVIQWRRLFTHLLPESSHGLDIVVENGSCGQVFTYRIHNVHSVVYVGPGDHHDRMHDHLEETLALQDLFLVSKDLEGDEASDSSLTEGTCSYSISVYPTQETYEAYRTNRPRIMTAVTAGVFVLFGIIVLLHDWLIRTSNHGKCKS